jgi:hypothetical protein
MPLPRGLRCCGLASKRDLRQTNPLGTWPARPAASSSTSAPPTTAPGAAQLLPRPRRRRCQALLPRASSEVHPAPRHSRPLVLPPGHPPARRRGRDPRSDGVQPILEGRQPALRALVQPSAREPSWPGRDSADEVAADPARLERPPHPHGPPAHAVFVVLAVLPRPPTVSMPQEQHDGVRFSPSHCPRWFATAGGEPTQRTPDTGR